MLYDISQIIVIVVLTFFLSCYIINYNSKIRAKGIKMVLKSQSAIHNKTKIFNPPMKEQDVFSQSKKHVQNYMLRVMVIDNNAYWVKDNVFFVASTENGNVLHDTAKQVDTSNMSKADIDKMMFILDKLKELN
jgi:uncharacterized ion transporter superfamily protein YfcC